MGARAPKPANFHAMSNAWDNPTGFAREIAAYYQQLRTSGHWKPATNFTEPKETT